MAESIVGTLGIEEAYRLCTGRSTANAKRVGSELKVHCPRPDHDDEHPSCDVNPERNVWNCKACESRGAQPFEGGIAALAIAAGHANNEADAFRWYENRLGRHDERTEFYYEDENGNPVGKVQRIDKGPKNKQFFQLRYTSGAYVMGMAGQKLPLYHLKRVRKTLASESGATVFLVEGERKCDTLQNAFDRAKVSNVVVTTIAGGSPEMLRAQHISALSGARMVIILTDSDVPGRTFAKKCAQRISEAFPKMPVKVIDLFPDEEAPKDIEDWLGAGHNIDELRELIKNTEKLKISTNGQVDRSRILSPREFLTLTEQYVSDWLIVNMLRRSGLLLLYGEPKAGKSDLARSLMKAVAEGTEWVGHRCRRGKVLWIGCEEPESHLAEKLEMLGVLDNDNVGIFADIPPDRPKDKAELLDRLVDEHRPSLVIIDTIGRFSGIDDFRDQAQVQKATAPMNALRIRRPETSFCLLHHSNSRGSVLGGPGWLAIADTILCLYIEQGRHLLKTDRQRAGLALRPTLLVQDEETSLVTAGPPEWRAKQDEIEASVRRTLASAPATREEVVRMKHYRAVEVRRAIDSLVSLGDVLDEGRGKPLRLSDRGEAKVTMYVVKIEPSQPSGTIRDGSEGSDAGTVEHTMTDDGTVGTIGTVHEELI